MRMPAADEQHLIDLARCGDQQAFRQLVECHMRRAYDLAFGFVGNHEQAEDIVQDAFIRVHRALDRFRGDAAFGTWLHRIVVNLAINENRRSRRRAESAVTEEDVATPDHGPAAHHESRESSLHLERAIHELPTLQRAVVILRHLEGMSTRQVSGILRCSEGTVKTHLFRAMRKLKKRLAYLDIGTA
jgi:RNA polymerase sigma-70 factor, ECF subfamily